MNVPGVLDVAMLATILLCGCDALRQIHPRRQPWRALAFALMTLGALGCMDALIRGASVPWFALVLHAGLAVYSALRLHARNVASGPARGLQGRRRAWP